MSFPINPIFLFADSQLLFYRDEHGKAVLEEACASLEKENIQAAYIGASNGDDPTYFAIFEAAMETLGIKNCRMIFAEYNEQDRDFLKEADLILLAGGDVHLGWQSIKEMQQDIIQRYYGGAILCGVSAGAVHLGLGGWSKELPESKDDMFETFKLIPFYVDAHDEENGWERLKKIVANTAPELKGVGLPKGGGLVFHPDHSLQPLRHSLVEFSGHEGVEITQVLLLPGDGSLGDGSLMEEDSEKPILAD